MPKKKRIYTETLYAYLKPVNRRFLEKYTEHQKVSYSLFIDALLETARRNWKKKTHSKAAA